VRVALQASHTPPPLPVPLSSASAVFPEIDDDPFIVTRPSDADHVWGVGTSVLDWNGRTWKQVENPQLGDLVAVSAPALNDAWAVGTHSHSVDPRQVYSEHWDGSHWSLVHMRQPAGTGFDEVNDVTPVSSHAWAVGRSGDPDGNGTLIEHFC